MQVEVVINPVSGRHTSGDDALRRCRALVERAARSAGAHAMVHVTAYHGHAVVLAREAAARGSATVVAWGGDGTVNEVASGLADSETALAIVPAGSGNGLARELSLPRSPARALAIAFARTTRRIDLGELNGRVFVNVAGIGFDACVARAFNARRTRGGWGLARYVYLALRESRRYEPARYRVTGGGDAFDTSAYVIAVANSAQYGNGARIAPQARLDDGLLDVVVVGVLPVWKRILDARRLFDGSIAAAAQVRSLTVQDGEIASDVPMDIHVDGEPLEPVTHAAVRVRRQSLLVVVG